MADDSGSCGDNVTWTYTSATGTLTIQGQGAMTDYSFAPWISYGGSIKTVVIKDGVTRIGDNAFYNCFALTSISIPNSVTIIRKGAFSGCTKLTNVTLNCNEIVSANRYSDTSLKTIFGEQVTNYIIGNNVTSIGNNVFSDCSSLTSVTIDNGLTSIGEGAFWKCSKLTSIKIPNSVTSIGDYAFRDCTDLTSISIPNSVESIGEGAFYNCTSLTSVSIPNSVTNIVMGTFYGCSSLTSVIIGNNVMSIGDYAFLGCHGLTSVTIPNSVASIGKHAFYNCSCLTSITIGNGVTSIGNCAFFKCFGLTSITIPNSVVNIGSSAFADCSSLKSITVTLGNTKYDSRDNCNAIIESAVDTLIVGCKTTIIPNSVTRIGDNAFYNCSGLTSISIPNSVTSIGNNSFKGCTDLNTINYFCNTLPTGWVATVNTYVPNKQSYSTPKEYINGASSSSIKQMISFDNNEFTYTGQKPTPKWTNNVEGYNAELSFQSLNLNTGNYSVNVPATFTKDSKSFVVNIPYEYSIRKANLTVKANNVSRQYGEENPTLPIEYTGFVNSETEDVLTTKPVGITTATVTSPVGTYPITVSGGEATNYAFTYEQGELTVSKAGLTAKVKDATKVYGEENPSFDIEYAGLKNGETVPEWTTAPTIQTEATKTSDVGDYAIKANDGVAKNYDLAIADGKLTITPAPLTIKANDMTRLYYSENPSLDYTCNGFVNGDDKSTLSVKPNLSTSATLTSNVGDYDIEANGAVNPNYSISYEKGKLSVTPRTLTASVGNYERIYNEENPAFEVTYAGFVGNEDESVISTKAVASTTATKTSDAGTYPIEVSGGGATNYVFSYNSGTLTINKAEQTISWEQDLTGLKVGEQVELKAESTSGLPVTYQMESNNVAEVYAAGTKWYLDCKADGEVQIVAMQEGNQNYYSSTRIRKKVVVGDITGIRAAKSDHNDNLPTYDTMGRKVQELKKGQLYIRQGKKFVAK